MNKFTALCFSLVLSGGFVLYAADTGNSVPKGDKPNLTEKSSAGKRVLDKRTRPDNGNSSSQNKLRKNLSSSTGLTTDKLYGDRCMPDPTGWGKVKGDGSVDIEISTNSSNGEKVTVAGVTDDKTYLFVVQSTPFGVLGSYLFTYDNSTHERTKKTWIEWEDYPQGGVFNPADNCVYGFALNGWIKYNCETDEIEILADVDVEKIFNPQITLAGDAIVGIDGAGNIYEYSFADGSRTQIGKCGLTSPYTGGFAYNAAEDCYYYNVNTDTESELYRIDGTSWATSKICDIADAAQVIYMLCTEEGADDMLAPEAAEFVAASWADGAYTGSLTFRLPSRLADGTAIAGTVDWSFSVNGTAYESGSGVPGSEVTVAVGADAGLKDGVATFALKTTVNGHSDKGVKHRIYVGYDTPCAPSNVVLTAESVSWDAVTEGVNGGYVDAANVTYNVFLNGFPLAVGISETSVASGISASAPLNIYDAKVYAENHGYTSEGSASNSLACGEPYTLPVSFAPTVKEGKLFSIFDANHDDSSWELLETSEFNAFQYTYNSGNDGDDWLFLPPVKVTDLTNLTKFTMDVYAQSPNYPERIEVRVGKEATPEAMSTVVIEPTDVDWGNEARTMEGYFLPAETGTYYVGVHAVSPADRLYLFARNFTVQTTEINGEGPAAVSNVVATAGSEGALEATLTFRMPTVLNNGGTINTDAPIKAVISDTEETKTVTGTAGQEMSLTIKTVQSDNNIGIQTFMGDISGMKIVVPVYTGVDLPGAPANLKAEMSEDNYSGKLVWEAPETGASGGFIRKTGIKYFLCRPQYTDFGMALVIAEEIGTDVFEFPFSVEEGSPLEAMQLGVVAMNEAGTGKDVAAVAFCPGKPLDMPAEETFLDEEGAPALNLKPIAYDYDNPDSPVRAGVGDPKTVSTPMADYTAGADGGAFLATTFGETTAEIMLPKFSTVGKTKLSFVPTFYVGSFANLKVTCETFGVAEEEIFDLAREEGLENGYKEFNIEIPTKFEGKKWIQIRVYPRFGFMKGTFVMDGYKVKADDDSSVGALTDENGGYIGTFPGGIIAKGFGGKRMVVAGVDGRTVYEGIVSDLVKVKVAPGIYVVSVGSQTAKVAVR